MSLSTIKIHSSFLADLEETQVFVKGKLVKVHRTLESDHISPLVEKAKEEEDNASVCFSKKMSIHERYRNSLELASGLIARKSTGCKVSSFSKLIKWPIEKEGNLESVVDD